MLQARGWLLVAALAAVPSTALASEAQRIDGIAAYVGGTTPGEGVTVILRSDVELRARLSLLAGGVPQAADAPLSDELLTATLDELLGESLVALEATRLAFATPTPADIKQQREALAAGADVEFRALVQTLGVSAAELDAIAHRRALVGAFLAANLEGTSTVSDSDLERAYQADDHPFRDEPFELARERLAAWLAQKRVREGVTRWVVSLRERTPHRILWSSY